MIHDAIAEVTCDREGCTGSVFVKLEWKYRNMNESSGFYDSNDADIEETLAKDHDWVVRDDGTMTGSKHFCSPICADHS